MVIGVFAAAGVLLLGLVIWVGTRMVRSAEGASTGASDALGNFIDVFDPARSRSDRLLKEWEATGAIIPSPDDDGDRPVTVDLVRGIAKVRRSHP